MEKIRVECDLEDEVIRRVAGLWKLNPPQELPAGAVVLGQCGRLYIATKPMVGYIIYAESRYRGGWRRAHDDELIYTSFASSQIVWETAIALNRGGKVIIEETCAQPIQELAEHREEEKRCRFCKGPFPIDQANGGGEVDGMHPDCAAQLARRQAPVPRVCEACKAPMSKDDALRSSACSYCLRRPIEMNLLLGVSEVY